MKVTTWNVNGVRAREAQVLEWLETEAPDILCLQEIKASPDAVPQAIVAHAGYWTYWHGHKGYSGVALNFSRRFFPEEPSFSHPAFDHENRIVTATVGSYVFASVYVPNGGKDFPAKLRFWEALEGFVRDLHAQGKQLILCGDLNVALEERDVHPKLRAPEQIGQTAEERQLFRNVLGQGLVDLSRQFEPQNDELYTWWAPWRKMRERNMGWRLDYVLVSEPLARLAIRCQAFREFGTSDHGPVAATFEVAPFERTSAGSSAQGKPTSEKPSEPPPPPPGSQLKLF